MAMRADLLTVITDRFVMCLTSKRNVFATTFIVAFFESVLTIRGMSLDNDLVILSRSPVARTNNTTHLKIRLSAIVGAAGLVIVAVENELV